MLKVKNKEVMPLSVVRKILQAILALSFLFTIFILLASMGMLSPLVESSQVEDLYPYAPTMSFTMLMVVLGAFSAHSWLAFVAMGIPALGFIGTIFRSINKWIYRVLVFVPLYITLANYTAITFPPTTSFLITAGYLVLAFVVDLLP